MNSTKTMLVLAIAFAGLTAAGSASAWHRHGPRVSIGIGFGVPFAAYPFHYPYYYPYYHPYYYPAPVIVQRQPVIYVEQQPAPQAQSQQQLPGYWYYCNESRAYYPYVKECAGAWQRVAPQPAAQ